MVPSLRIAVAQLSVVPVPVLRDSESDSAAKADESNILDAILDAKLPAIRHNRLDAIISDSAQRFIDNSREKLRQLLRFTFLYDTAVAVLGSRSVPFDALDVVIDFTGRMTVVGQVSDVSLDTTMVQNLRAELVGPFPESPGFGFLLSPYANIVFDPGFGLQPQLIKPTLDLPGVSFQVFGESEHPGRYGKSADIVISNSRSHHAGRAKAGIASIVVGSSDEGLTGIRSSQLRSAVSPPFPAGGEGIQVVDLRMSGPRPKGQTAGTVWASAPILYSARDIEMQRLLDDLRGLSRLPTVPPSMLEEVRERYRDTVTLASEIPLFRQVITTALDEGRIPLQALHFPVMPEQVLAPEETYYLAFDEALLVLRQARDVTPSGTAQRERIETLWKSYSLAQTKLVPLVRPRLLRVSHRVGTDIIARSKTQHWLFYATIVSFDPSSPAELQRSLARQLSMLRTLCRLETHRISIKYRLFTMPTSHDDLEAVFEIVCIVEDADAATAEQLRASFGELVHSAFIGTYGLSFNPLGPMSGSNTRDIRLEEPLFRSEIVRRRKNNGNLHQLQGYPDWGYVLDYVRSLDEPVVIELECTAFRGNASWDRTAEEPAEGGWLGAELDNASPGDSILLPVLASATADTARVLMRISAASNEPLPLALMELIGVEVGGPGLIDTLPYEAMSEEVLVPWVEERAFNLRQAIRTFHPPFGEFFAGGTSRSGSTSLPVAGQDFPVAGTYFGRAHRSHAKSDKWIPVRVPEADRTRHTYVIGKTGTGKTNFLKGLATQDLESPSRGLTIIDPHGDLAQHVLNSIPRLRIREVQVIDLSEPDYVPVLNPLLFDKGDSLVRSRAIQEVIELLRSRVFHQYTGPRFDESVRLAVDSLLDEGYGHTPSLIDVPRLLTETDYQNEVRRRLKDRELRSRWDFHDTLRTSPEYGEVIDWVVSKFDDLARDETLRCVLGGSKNTVSVEEVVTQNGILIVHVPEGVVGRQTAEFIGALVLMRLRMALYRRTQGRFAAESLPQHLVYVDEFQKFASGNFEELVAEARKFGVGFVLANQNLEQLREFSSYTGQRHDQLLNAILGNVASLIVFGVGSLDADLLARQMGVSLGSISRIAAYEALAKLTVNGRELPTFSLRTDYTAPRSNPRTLDDLKLFLIDNDRIVRRDQVLADIAARRRQIDGDSEDWLAQIVTKGAEKLEEAKRDEWLEKRRKSRALTDPSGLFDARERGKSEQSSAGELVTRSSATDTDGTPETLGSADWSKLVGTFLRKETAAKRLRIEPQSLSARADQGELLRLMTSDNVEVYPEAQFVDNQTVEGLAELLAIFDGAFVDGWTLAGWLCVDREELAGSSVLGWLRSHGDPELVFGLARAAAGRFSL